ncbi:MAG TPA: ATP-binding protein, partial [Tepidisphaeraceae bacterium]|nr:ATP-binding protein [Tepidisphaeraceae bacterium]
PLRAKQVLVNLVGNAIKFTETGHIKIGIYREISYFAQSIRFEVTDTGIGMTPEQMGRLFQPFSQADVSTTRRFGGTGLGLTISKRLAKLLGGDITVKSEPGAGSTFVFQLDGGPRLGVPVVENLTVDQLSVSSSEATDEDIQITGRVLVAEDGEDNRELVTAHLTHAGAEVVLVETGLRAVEAVKKQKFDLILLDMQMPELDGYGAARVMRAAGVRVPIIALTANAMAEDRVRCLQAGCTEYLSKPITRAKLLRTLARFLPTATPSEATPGSNAARASDTETAGGLKSAVAAEPSMQDLLVRFISRLPDRVNAIQGLLDVEDLNTLRETIHQLKGAAGGYGFPQVTEQAARAEQKIVEKEPLTAIRDEVDSLVKMVRSIGGYDESREVKPPKTSAA